MEKKKRFFNKTKRFKVASATLASLMLTTTAVVLPTVFYGTANNLLYVDTFGKVQARAPEEVAPPHNPYKGTFDPANSYKAGDVVNYEKVVFHDDRLRDNVSTVTSTEFYEITEDWVGDATKTFDDAKTKSFDPFQNNFTKITVPFSQLFTIDTNKSMGYSTKINGIGRSSITGKFSGAGGIYGPYDRPGFAYVQSDNTTDNYNVTITELGRPFAWAKKAPSAVYIQNSSGGKDQRSTPSTLPENAVPEFYETQENWFKIRNEYYNNGMVAYKFDNQGEITDLWRSDIKPDTIWHYEDMWDGFPYLGSINSGINSADFALMSSMDNSYQKNFALDDENLGLYIYSKASPYAFADRAACNWWGLASDKQGYSANHGFYQGTGEPLVYFGDYDQDKWGDTGSYNYLGQHQNKRIMFYTRSGADQEVFDNHQLVGAYMYSNSGQWPQDSNVINYVNNDFYGNADNPSAPLSKVYGEIYSWLTGTPERILRNNARSFSYYNGVFSLNKPSDQLAAGENQEVRWYTPLASTDMKITLNQDKIDESKDTKLATDAMNASIADFVNFEMYNAIPSSFYGGEVTMAADNVTGTIWLKFKTGPVVDVVNGSLFKEKQEATTNYEVPGWLKTAPWTYYNDRDGVKVGSATWNRDNTHNPVMEISMAKPLEYAVGITGFPEIKPTKIIDTTNPDGTPFEPGAGIVDDTVAYGPYRLTSATYTSLTPFEYIDQQEKRVESERYKELLQIIYDELIINKEPTFGIHTKPDGTPFIQLEDLVMTSAVNPFNFADELHPEWGGRIQFSITLKKYFDKNGEYVDGSGGFEPKLVRFCGFKSVPGPTQVNGNYNLNSLIPGGATNFNKQNLPGGNGVNYPSDYLADSLVTTPGTTKYDWLTEMVNRWSNPQPFKGDDAEKDNKEFTPDSYMIKNLPPINDTDPSRPKYPFSLTEKDVKFNNFTGLLRITPTFNSYYSQKGELIKGVTTTLGTITISGFQTVNGSTYIPNVVNAISTNMQPSAIVTSIGGIEQTSPIPGETESFEYIGEELYKIVWNEAINLPTKDYDLPPYDDTSITPEKLQEIRRVVDIRVRPNDREWVNNIEGSLKFAVSFKKMFNKDGVPTDIPKDKLWPAGWENGAEDDDNVFIVTAYGYDNSPGATGVLQVDGKNRNIVVNQPNYQPSEFIKNDAQAGYPLLKSLIAGNLTNLPKTFTTDDIVLDVAQFNTEATTEWNPDPVPLKPDNRNGLITVTVYLKKYYDSVAKLCNYEQDNKGEPYTSPVDSDVTWTFTISGFMKTNAIGASDLSVNDERCPSAAADKHSINLADPKVYAFMKENYPEIAALKGKLPYQVSSTTDIKNLISIKNKSASSSVKQPYLLMANIPSNIRPYNIIIDPANVTIDNTTGTLKFRVNLRQWFTNDAKNGITYHPTLDDQSTGNDMYTTPNEITISGMKSVSNATVINPINKAGDTDTMSSDGVLTLSHTGTSEKIIKGILKGRYLDTNPEATVEDSNKEFADFDVTKIQPSQLDDLRLKEYIYVALIESGGSPYTLEPGSMVINQGTADDPIYRIKDENALNDFITWKINPFIDLTEGTVILSPMLNIWFGGDDVQVYNQYQSFGGGENGKPSVTKNDDGSVTVTSARVTQLTLKGFLAAKNTLQFNSASVYDGQVNVVLKDMDTTKITALQFANNGFTTADGTVITLQGALMDTNKLQISAGGIVQIVDEPGITSEEELQNIANLIDFSNKNYFKVNPINGTIEIKTKVVKYFDANKILQTGSINLVLTGFLPSTEAYETTYIIIITTIIALIVILAIVLARILWVRYARTRDEYKNN